jgi:hypothetical protein
LTEATKSGFITESDYERKYYEKDGWGRDFMYKTGRLHLICHRNQ